RCRAARGVWRNRTSLRSRDAPRRRPRRAWHRPRRKLGSKRVRSLAAGRELAAALVAGPRAVDRTIRQLEILDLAFDDVAHGAAVLVLAFGLEVHDPAVRLERRFRERHVVRARVDHARDRFAVPIEDQQYVVAVNGIPRPFAEP